MDKQVLIEKLLSEKAKIDNKIDLNAYALGLDAMYEALRKHSIVRPALDSSEGGEPLPESVAQNGRDGVCNTTRTDTK